MASRGYNSSLDQAAYNQGFVARERNKPLSACPYTALGGSRSARSMDYWLKGYWKADDKMKRMEKVGVPGS
jgi:hypothetical protein